EKYDETRQYGVMQRSLSAIKGQGAVVFPPGEDLASGGPQLITNADGGGVMDDEAREMVAQIVFTEHTAQTPVGVNSPNGGGPVTVRLGNAITFTRPLGQGNNRGNINVSTNRTRSVGAASRKRVVPSTPSVGAPQSLLPPIPDAPILDPGSNSVAPADSGPVFDPTVVLQNGSFDSGSDHWETEGPGIVNIIADPDNLSDMVAELVSSSPVSLFQQFETPDAPFAIVFDYQ
ncbi:MAG: hypothetical protein ACKVGZ_13070, partial [Alphaproteobacteria bacterium]